MTQEIRNNGIQDYVVIIADEGKALKRKGTDEIFGSEIALGYSYYISGIKLDEPHLDVPEDFEEVDAPPEESDDYVEV
jgi:hypothetical protein